MLRELLAKAWHTPVPNSWELVFSSLLFVILAKPLSLSQLSSFSTVKWTNSWL